MTQYSVTGPFPYHGHEPGATFEAKADDAIKRAVARGSIAPVKKSEPAASPAASTPTPSASPSGKAASNKEEK